MSKASYDKERALKKQVESARKHLLDKKFDKAINELKSVLKHDTQRNDLFLEARFYLGVSYLDSNQPLLSIKQFCIMIQIKPDYKHLAYLILSLAYRRVNQHSHAIKVLTKGLKYFAKVSEMYLVRG